MPWPMSPRPMKPTLTVPPSRSSRKSSLRGRFPRNTCPGSLVGGAHTRSFSVGDVTTDPTTGRTPTEAERIKAMVTVALKTEEIGLDVFATGEHHNPLFVPSSPTMMFGYLAARTERIILSGHHPDHHQRPGEDRRGSSPCSSIWQMGAST